MIEKYKYERLDYIYIIEDEYIKLYGVIKKENSFYKIFIEQFNYHLYGERMIEKLKGRGYLSEIEANIKYPDGLPTLEDEKVKKNIFLKKRK